MGVRVDSTPQPRMRVVASAVQAHMVVVGGMVEQEEQAVMEV